MFVGQSISRKEDARLVRGAGRFIADVRRPGMLQVSFARSAVAHGRLVRVDVAEARATPGVVAVLTAADLAMLAPVPGMQNPPPASWREAVAHRIDIPDQPILANDRVRYVGEPIAVIVAQSRLIAEDAAERVRAVIEPFAALTGVDAARAPGAPQIHAGSPGNVVARFTLAKGDVARAMAAPLRRIRRRFVNHRFLAAPLECRGVVAEYDCARAEMTVWSATQVVHWVKREVAKNLGIAEEKVRCIAPDVGGGFGVKGHVYPEDILIPHLARRLARPVAWIEQRREHLIHSTHSRDDVHDAELLFDDDGRIHALVDTFVKDSGAYTPVGIGALSNTATHIAGPYDIPVMRLEAIAVATNKAPNAPYRGSGRPEAAFVIERLLDLAAHELGIEPAAIRLRNMIGPERMPFPVGLPYRDGAPIVYDGGDFAATMQAGLTAIGGLGAFRDEQARARASGKLLGFGIGFYLEASGAGPFEGATVRIEPGGGLHVATGACSQGQSHETVFAQVAADEWGVRPDDVHIAINDTAAIERGYGTIASRSAVNSSSAIRKASATLRQRVLAIAAGRLECDARDLELRDGAVRLKGVQAHGVTLAELAAASDVPLLATEYWEPPTVTWSHGAHLAVVEIDRDTGVVEVRRYVVAHDAGVLINPMVAEGQIAGGVVQGIGGCLRERVCYDAAGQILTGTFTDYAMPRAGLLRAIDIVHRATPSALNPLGVRGLGEGGIVGAPAALANAVCDALAHLGVEWNESCIDPPRLQELIARRLRRLHS